MMIPWYSLVQANVLAPIRYKDSGLKLLFTFQVWPRLFVEGCSFLFSYFHIYCMNVSHAIPDDIKHFQQAEPEHYYISPIGRQKAT